ncbi:hypothetical protein J4231_03805 [Candidatus Woesearchaeota archaeon]|nr:hypothetical protein [Candidatus Woesearchaeota archaeon]
MIEVETRLKTWGNSIGIVIPKEKIEKERLKIDQNVRVIISPTKMLKVENIFGKLKGWKRPTRGIAASMDKDLDSKFFK